MQTVTLKEAQEHLAKLIRELPEDGEVTITDANKPVARLFPAARPSLRDLKPQSIGAVLRPFPSSETDLLDEMLHSDR